MNVNVNAIKSSVYFTNARFQVNHIAWTEIVNQTEKVNCYPIRDFSIFN